MGMKISRNWIGNYVPLEVSAKEIEEALTLIGFEVEGVERLGLPDLPAVVVGEVVTAIPHPNAEKLSLCTVQTALLSEPRQIVCGAKNFRVGDRVPVALPGAVLPGGLEIREATLRGQLSQGMMCSARELGMGEDHAGLLILTQRPEIGTPINQVFPDNDYIFDLEVTPNRPDCLSHVGMARELAAYFDLELRFPELWPDDRRLGGAAPSPLLHEAVSETDNCPHYRGYSIRGVKIAPSPAWLQQALAAIGLRPINNIVDVTNYVLHELGQPLHAFDAAKLRGHCLRVRQARAGETFVTLDGKERLLDERMTVIADGERAVAIAGVMGGLFSEVDEQTTDIVLEAACFNPANVRYTSRKLSLSTDASYRFERGIDPKGTELAALRAIDLILQTAGGTLCAPVQVFGNPPLIEREIEITTGFICARLGFSVTAEEVRDIFERLKFIVAEGYDAQMQPYFRVRIPSFRLDLDRPVDLVEEFLRIYGTPKIPASEVLSHALVAEDHPIPVWLKKVSTHLVERGYAECMHYTMRSEEESVHWYPEATGPASALRNPLASDQSHLRPSLLPGCLDALKLNLHRRNAVPGLFETGRVFRDSPKGLQEWISVALLCPVEPQEKTWLPRTAPDFFTMAGQMEMLLHTAGLTVDLRRAQSITGQPSWQDGHAASLSGEDGRWLAEYGLLSLRMSKAWDVNGQVLAAALYLLPEFFHSKTSRVRYQPFSQYPDTTRDLALLVDSSVPADAVREAVEKTARQVVGGAFAVEETRVFDLYLGTGLPEGKKSLAIGLRFRGFDRTLTDDEVNKAFQAIQQRIEAATGYKVRN